MRTKLRSPLLPTLLSVLCAALSLALPIPAWAHDGHHDGHHDDHHDGRSHAPPAGRITVVNHAGASVTVGLTGQPGRTLSAWQTATFTVPQTGHGPAETTLRATYTQFGVERTLQSTRLVVAPGRTEQITLGAERVARILVTNRAPLDAQLLVDGKPFGSVAAGDARVLTLPAGSPELRMTAGGRIIGRTRLELRAFAEPTWSVEAPTTGFVDLSSRHFLSTEVRIDGRRMVTLDANGTARSRVTVGWHEVVVTDARGRVVSRGWVEVKPFEAAQMRFGTPAHVEARDGHDADSSHDGHRDGRVERRDDRGAAVADAGEGCGHAH